MVETPRVWAGGARTEKKGCPSRRWGCMARCAVADVMRRSVPVTLPAAVLHSLLSLVLMSWLNWPVLLTGSPHTCALYSETIILTATSGRRCFTPPEDSVTSQAAAHAFDYPSPRAFASDLDLASRVLWQVTRAGGASHRRSTAVLHSLLPTHLVILFVVLSLWLLMLGTCRG